MAIRSEEMQVFREALEQAARPLILYDDDADGLASFLLACSVNSEARGVRVARGPEVSTDFARYVEEHIPDALFIVDKPRVDKELFTSVQTPTIWLDHHDPETQKPHEWSIPHLTYMNPMLENREDSRSTSYWMWKITGGPLWIAAIGCAGDWDESVLEEFSKQYPELAPKKLTAEDALYGSKLGVLSNVLNFAMKGKNSTVTKVVSALRKIKEPQEILSQTTPAGKFVWKQYQHIEQEYSAHLEEASKSPIENGFLMHVFPDMKISFVSEMSNHVRYNTGATVVLLGRRSEGRIKFSLRSTTHDLRPIVEKALEGVDGYGGGHKSACGGSVVEHDWDAFIEKLKELL